MKGVLLRSGDGRRFLVAQLMDSMAGGLSLVVLPWIVLDAGGSPSLAGAAFLIATVPYLVLGLHAGELGDRRRRQPIMVWCAAAQALAAAVLPAIVALGPAARDLPIALVFAAGMGVTAGRVFVDAAAFGATARLVGDAHFVEGQANLSLVWSLGFLIGPALGGALIGLVGAVEALWIESAGFAVSAVLLATIRTDLGPEGDGSGRAPVLEGIGVVARDRTLRRLTSVSMAWNLTVNVFYALMVVFLRTELHATGLQAGRMLAIGGAAGLAGGAAAPLARERMGPTGALRLGLVASAAASVALALAPGLGVATAAFSGLEISGLFFITLVIGERQTRANPSQQARVGITGRMAALLASSVGAVAASALVAVLSPGDVFAVAAAGTVGVAAVAVPLLRLEG
ncbi:MAG TPA: MFS transporter [Gaiellales bacterium]|nr:MFS transporter [Gaiellales bacterium]